MKFTSLELQRNLNAIIMSSVEDLNLDYVDVSEVPAELLAQTVSHLHKISFRPLDKLNKKQLVAIFNGCISSTTLVEFSLACISINLACIDLDEVPLELLGRAVGRLQKLTLELCKITNEQCLALFEACSTSPTLVDLTLKRILNTEGVPAEILRQVPGNLHRLNLENAYLNDEQCLALLNGCIKSPTLIELSLDGVGLVEVPSETLGQLPGHLQRLNLDYTVPNNEQCLALLNGCINSQTLIELSLEGVGLDEVPAETLGQLPGHLHRLNLDMTELDDKQCLSLLNGCIKSQTLIELSLEGVELEEVPVEIIEQLPNHLHKLNLDGTGLTNKQCRTLLEACIKSPTLVELSLRHLELSEVPPKILCQAARHFQFFTD